MSNRKTYGFPTVACFHGSFSMAPDPHTIRRGGFSAPASVLLVGQPVFFTCQGETRPGGQLLPRSSSPRPARSTLRAYPKQQPGKHAELLGPERAARLSGLIGYKASGLIPYSIWRGVDRLYAKERAPESGFTQRSRSARARFASVAKGS